MNYVFINLQIELSQIRFNFSHGFGYLLIQLLLSDPQRAPGDHLAIILFLIVKLYFLPLEDKFALSLNLSQDPFKLWFALIGNDIFYQRFNLWSRLLVLLG